MEYCYSQFDADGNEHGKPARHSCAAAFVGSSPPRAPTVAPTEPWLAATFQNWLSLACILLPIGAAVAYRIWVEELALEAAFGDEYRQYAATTKRLIPGVL